MTPVEFLNQIQEKIDTKDSDGFKSLLDEYVDYDKEIKDQIIEKILADNDCLQLDQILYQFFIKKFSLKETLVFFGGALGGLFDRNTNDLNAILLKTNRLLSLCMQAAIELGFASIVVRDWQDLLFHFIKTISNFEINQRQSSLDVLDRLFEALLIDSTSVLSSVGRKEIFDSLENASFMNIAQEDKLRILACHPYARSYVEKLSDKSLHEIAATEPSWALYAVLESRSNCPIDEPNEEGLTALTSAINYLKPSNAEILLKTGASVNSISADHWVVIYSNRQNQDFRNLGGTLENAYYKQMPGKEDSKKDAWNKMVFEALDPVKIASKIGDDRLIKEINGIFMSLARECLGVDLYRSSGVSDEAVLQRVSALLGYPVRLAEPQNVSSVPRPQL